MTSQINERIHSSITMMSGEQIVVVMIIMRWSSSLTIFPLRASFVDQAIINYLPGSIYMKRGRLPIIKFIHDLLPV